MIQEKPLLPYFQWLLQFDADRWGAIPHFLMTLLLLAVVATLLGLVIGTILYGPVKAGEKVYRVVANALREMFDISPRRIWAIAKVAMQRRFAAGYWSLSPFLCCCCYLPAGF